MLVQCGAILDVVGGASSAADLQVKSGTGFFVSPGGLLLTSAHVVAGCRGIIIWPITGHEWVGQVVSADESLDIALVSAQGEAPGFSLIVHDNGSPRSGEAVTTIGLGIRSSRPREPVVTTGSVIGRAMDTAGHSLLLIKARLRDGNSGGPVIDANGTLLGMVTGRDTNRPEIGVAIPTNAIDMFLSRYGIGPMPSASPLPHPKNPTDLLKAISALVQCAPARDG